MRLLLILLLTMPTILFSQSREGKPKLNFGTASAILTKATGWAYNSTLGEWVDYQNCINNDKDYKTKYKSLLNGFMQSKQQQNFITIQSKTVDYSGTKYYVLIVQKWNGRYKYESIEEDWYEWKETFGYIFSESEYQKLKNLTGLIELKTQFSVSNGSSFESFDETKFLDLIQTELGNSKSKYDKEFIFPILITESDTKKVIRFYVPDISRRKYDFDKRYFETSPAEFDKIIIKD